MNRKESPRITTLKNLAGNYFTLSNGHLIEKPEETLRVVSIKEDYAEGNHPHKKSRVYITRKALKHFVESRKKELLKHHKEADALLSIYFAIEQIPVTILYFDKYEFEVNPEKFFYTKYYQGVPSIRILLTCPEEGILEINSIHFTKSKKENKNK